MRNLLLAGVALASVSLAVSAQAAPVLSYEVYDDAKLIGSGSSPFGIISIIAADRDFTVSGSATGAPLLTSPNFSTTDFTTDFRGDAATITIRVTDTGLTKFASGNVMNTFTLNSLTAPSFIKGTVTNYFDNGNVAFGTGTLLATSTFTGDASFSSSQATAASPSALFSETAIYKLTFGAGPVGSLSASSQLIATPEPASLALLGAGLAGIGFIRRRRA